MEVALSQEPGFGVRIDIKMAMLRIAQGTFILVGLNDIFLSNYLDIRHCLILKPIGLKTKIGSRETLRVENFI